MTTFNTITEYKNIKSVLKDFPVSRRFVEAQVNGNTSVRGLNDSVYNELLKGCPADHTIKTWLALHIKWADIIYKVEGKTAYKLFKQRKDGSIGPLFIGAKKYLETNIWYEAEDIPTKGFAHRPGWHCGEKPSAPHLSMNPKGGCKRVWYKVKIKDYYTFKRPANQGGEWLIAQQMMIVREV